MIEVRTFLKWDQFFVPVEDFKGTFKNLSHIEGAIELSIDQRPLLTRELWDDVDQLWALLLQCLHRLQAGESAAYFFEQMQLLAPQYEEELESLFQLEQTLKS